MNIVFFHSVENEIRLKFNVFKVVKTNAKQRVFNRLDKKNLPILVELKIIEDD